MKAQSFYAYVMIIAVVSFLGFWVENIWLSVTKGYMDSRGMVFPFLIGYGLAVVALYFLFGIPGSAKFFGISFDMENTVLMKIDTSHFGLYKVLQRLRGQTQSGGKIAG